MCFTAVEMGQKHTNVLCCLVLNPRLDFFTATVSDIVKHDKQWVDLTEKLGNIASADSTLSSFLTLMKIKIFKNVKLALNNTLKYIRVL